MRDHRLRRLVPLTALTLLSGCAITTIMTQGRSLATFEGEAAGPGLSVGATIHRDAKGIPHVRARSAADAVYGIGYVHGQDRQFQMDLTRRLMFGEMSELLGPDFVQYDAFMQSMDLRGHAERSLIAMDPDTKFELAAYAAGVNAAASAGKVPPLEYRLLEIEDPWREWTPTDSMAAAYLQSWGLGGPWRELASFMVRDALDRDDMDALFRFYPEAPRTDPFWNQVQKAQTGAMTDPWQGFMKVLGPGDLPDPAASNNWVVGPERSADGSAILANDPHLGRQVPAVWHIVEAKGGDLHVAGGTVPGIPYVATGHNETLAWGVTNVMADYIDFVMLQRKDGGYVLAGEQKAYERRTVTLNPRGADGPVTVEVVTTEVGPVVTDPDDGAFVLAMRWSALELEEGGVSYLRALNYSGTVEQVMAMPEPMTSVGLNFVFADTLGDYSWRVIGSYPVRKGHTGAVPYPGSSEFHGWDGWQTGLPQVTNPDQGYVITANNRPQVEMDADVVTADVDAISTTYIPPWRHDRIQALIEGQDAHTVESVGEIQNDSRLTHAEANLRDWIGDLSPQSVGGQFVAETLNAWDFESGPRSVAPLVWFELNKQLTMAGLEGHVSPDQLEWILRVSTPGRTILDTPAGLAHWVKDTDVITRQAMLSTYDALVAAYGEDHRSWTWGTAHAVTFDHPFKVGLLSAGSAEMSGGPNAVNQTGFGWTDNYETKWIASMRIVTPLSDVNRAQVVLPPGQSGQPGSKHYEDQLRTWAGGGTVPLWFSDEDVERHAEATLQLTP